MKRDQDKISELNQELIRTAKKEELARQELAEQKKSAAAFAASSAEKLKASQKEKLELEAALDKVDVIDFMIFCFFFMAAHQLCYSVLPL